MAMVGTTLEVFFGKIVRYANVHVDYSWSFMPRYVSFMSYR